MNIEPQVIITFDLDWSPDWMIEDVCRILDEYNASSTWFVTHDSEAVRLLRLRSDKVELGIHPNCLPGSSHGQTEREALTHIRQIVPEAVSMRTHGLYQSTAFLLLASAEFGIKLDSSIFLPSIVEPFDLAVDTMCIRRVPFVWADDLTMRSPAVSWEVPDNLRGPGPRVFAFHPFHIALNTVDYSLYEKMKAECPLPRWTKSFVAEHRNGAEGPSEFLQELVRSSARNTRRIKDLLEQRVGARSSS